VNALVFMFPSSVAQGCLQAVQILCEYKSPINLKDLVSARWALEMEMMASRELCSTAESH
jgi:hypothetical protein